MNNRQWQYYLFVIYFEQFKKKETKLCVCVFLMMIRAFYKSQITNDEKKICFVRSEFFDFGKFR